jgi:hypothetical protein
MNLLKDIIVDTCIDSVKMLPFLFLAFILIESLEHYSGTYLNKMLTRVGKAGPIVGAVAGCIPQCGFSVMASNLYAGGILSVGTLLSVFIATSDEAILIILGNPGYAKEVGKLLLAKVIIAILAGYVVDIFFSHWITEKKECVDLCTECGCHEEKAGILLPAWRHTVKIFLYLFLFNGIINLCIEMFGIEQLSAFLLGNTIFQPVIAALIGLIPNCAASVILTQLYLNGAISFASVISGLSTGAGVGLVVLFKMNNNKKENTRIVGMLVAIAVAAGIILELFAM